MSATGITPRSALVPAELVHDLGVALSRRMWNGSAVPTGSPEIHQLLTRCEDPDRRRELEQFVAHVECLPERARRDFAVAVHPVQVRSKLWLIDEVLRLRDLGSSSLLVLGAWYGILPLLINWRVARPPSRMVCIDIDPAACELGERVIGALYENIEYDRADVMEIDYPSLADGSSTLLINTICEHLPRLTDWWERVPAGQFVVLQSNNYAGCPDHVNCVADLDQFKRQTPLSRVLFEGILEFSDLDRFMLIGRR